MKLLILSDLHDDFWSESGRDPFDGIEKEVGELDHLILAGDVANKPKVRWKFAFERLSKILPLDRVSVFPGNHDFYNFRIDEEDRLEQIAASFGVQYVLDLSRFDTAPLRAFTATKETDYGTETDGRISPGCGAYRADQWAYAQAGG